MIFLNKMITKYMVHDKLNEINCTTLTAVVSFNQQPTTLTSWSVF